jgi:hypothetical protein
VKIQIKKIILIMKLSIFLKFFLLCLFHSYYVKAFTNFLGELFNDLRYG